LTSTNMRTIAYPGALQFAPYAAYASLDAALCLSVSLSRLSAQGPRSRATSSTSMLLSSWHEPSIVLFEIKSLAEYRFLLSHRSARRCNDCLGFIEAVIFITVASGRTYLASSVFAPILRKPSSICGSLVCSISCNDLRWE
jgi:hypothetical protein